jgi:hypothetical protein
VPIVQLQVLPCQQHMCLHAEGLSFAAHLTCALPANR